MIKGTLAVVIVSYHPDVDGLKNLCLTINQSNIIPIIIDNCTLNDVSISELASNATIIKLTDNLGIAVAQNIGIKKAIENGADYVMFFDQDSNINESFIPSLMKDLQRVIKRGDKLATIGPAFKDSRYGFYYDVIMLDRFGFRKKINPSKYNDVFEVSLIISSGSIIPIDVMKNVGMMNEDLFIDYVDTEWCLRALSMGYKIYVSPNVLMEHAIGDKMIKFLKFNIPVHSGFRRYYRIRNCIYFFKMKHVPVVLKCRDFLFNIIHQIIIILMSKEKKTYFKSLFNGISDGFSYLFSRKK